MACPTSVAFRQNLSTDFPGNKPGNSWEQPVLWGRMASCAAIGNRRCSRACNGPGRPIGNRPQIDNLPHKVTSGDKILEIRFIETIYQVTLRTSACAAGVVRWRSITDPETPQRQLRREHISRGSRPDGRPLASSDSAPESGRGCDGCF